MNSYVAWFLSAALIVAFGGTAGYFFEVWKDRVSLSTRWEDLNRKQFIYIVMTLGGSFAIMLTLIIGAFLK